MVSEKQMTFIRMSYRKFGLTLSRTFSTWEEAQTEAAKILAEGGSVAFTTVKDEDRTDDIRHKGLPR